MKIYTKLIIMAVVLTMATECYAQFLEFGIKAGLNLSKMLAKNDEETFSDELDLKPGFFFGPTAEYPINDIFSIETGLLLTTKGFEINEENTIGDETFESKQKANLYYLDVPLTAKAKFTVGIDEGYVAFGPYIGMGLTGKSKTEYTQNESTHSTKQDIEWGSNENEDDLKRLDFGLTVGGGAEIESFVIGLSYSLGLANISPITTKNTKFKNRVLALSVGYKF